MELHRSSAVGSAIADNAPRIATAPPLHRSSMAAEAWHALNPLAIFTGSKTATHSDGPARSYGTARRLLLLTLTLAPAFYATYVMSGLLPTAGATWLEVALLGLFALLSCWVAAGFWTAIMGFTVLARGGDRYLISRSAAGRSPIPAAARTAIVMPIANEDVKRVFAGLRASYESLERSGELEHFDFYVLSDSNDPDICVAELKAWRSMVDTVDGSARIFYRRRSRRVKRKSGNLDDFCRRWGADYRYMVVLDADSVMSGDCLATLVRLMEARPDAGIIQTAPRAALRETLHARAQQFSTYVYGPIFTAGLHFWQLGESHYWGHNAIVRLAPFMRHCALAPLPGRGSLSGEILSHDFVEAALMRRAGWGVWIAYDLLGSYEETPPNLLDEVKRDRRWCQGNLMNFRLMVARGMHPVHRTVFLTGALAYLSAPLWLSFLALSTWLLIVHANTLPQYFVMPYQLFPLWPSWKPHHALALFGAMATLLFLPKILGAIVTGARDAREYGGVFRLGISAVLEMLLSALLAPVRMLFHTQFVLAALSGWAIQWKSPARNDDSTPWSQAVRRHGLHTLMGIAWLGAVLWLAPEYAGWLAPVALGLILSIPISVYTSRASWGLNARRIGLFLTPPEIKQPRELAETRQYNEAAGALPNFVDAVLDPGTFSLVYACARTRHNRLARARLDEFVRRALAEGPAGLSVKERLALLGDAQALLDLHSTLRSARAAFPAWQNVRGAVEHAGTAQQFKPRPGTSTVTVTALN